ncbi:MAG TPA: hypothetical protein VG963_23715 [Polyangiaceae bacterium]|nr:hypothetical protein [Polyangiaceae bacterium]
MKEKLQEIWGMVHLAQAEARRAGDLSRSTSEIRVHSIKRDIEPAARALEHLDGAASRHYTLVRALFDEKDQESAWPLQMSV